MNRHNVIQNLRVFSILCFIKLTLLLLNSCAEQLFMTRTALLFETIFTL